MNLNTKEWKEFKIGDLFEVSLSSGDLKLSECLPGEIPLVSSGMTNNGIVGYIDSLGDGKAQIFPKNTITVDMFCNAFYQNQNFYSVSHGRVNILTPKFEMNEQIGMFITTLINKENYKYSYGRAVYSNEISRMILKLPVQNNGLPNWEFIENYIKNLNYKPISTQRKSNIKNIEFNKWHEFSVEDIFNIYNGKGITSEEIEFNPGNFNAIQSGEENNGIIGRIDKNYCIEKKYTLTENQCLTVARTGSAGFVSYQPEGCVVGDSAKILILKEKERANKYIYLFLRTILMANKYKYTYGRKVTEDKYLKEKIMLPSKKIKNEEFIPDWDFMEKYIRELPYGDRIK